MSVDLVPEEDLRAALRPFRVDPAAFEAAIRQRLTGAPSPPQEAFAGRLSPWLRGAAAFLPVQIITGGKLVGAATGPVGGAAKLAGYLAFPAISLFVLLGATIFSVVKIRRTKEGFDALLTEEKTVRAGLEEWWRLHRWGAIAVYVVSLVLSFIGATWLLFVFYIVSLGLLCWIISSLARHGLGNRTAVGQSCLMGLAFLGQMAGFWGIGDREIHFVDQIVIAAVFYTGTLILLPLVVSSTRQSGVKARGWIPTCLFGTFLVAMIAWFVNPLLWPATPERIKRYVESFSEARFSSASWEHWEIVAEWAIEARLDPDLSAPRRLLAEEIAGPQNPYVLGSAFRVGLVQSEQLDELRDYKKQRSSLFDDTRNVQASRPIGGLEQYDWVIRAAVLRNDLTLAERDYLEQRLHATMEARSVDQYRMLKDALRVTQLLATIGRPVPPVQYREQVHNWLRTFHATPVGAFQSAGGFKSYADSPAGDLEATACAVQLMEFYGIPDGLDLNWVRSFLRPMQAKTGDRTWVAAATRERLKRLPGATPPSWLEIVYHERSLLAAAVLVGMCLYATLCSPVATSLHPVQPDSTPRDR